MQPIVQSKCAQCHYRGGIGPYPFETYGDFSSMAGPARKAIEAGTMPPWPADNSCADYTPNGALSDEQRATLFEWFDNGMPPGEGQAPAVVPQQPTGLSAVDLTVSMPEAFTPMTAPDEYRCFILDWPETDVAYITGLSIRPGVNELVHHADLLFIKPDAVAKYQAKDDAAPGPGYPCYSFPDPFGEGGWLGTFVPGSLGADFPPDTGVKMVPGSKLFLQMHYHLSSHTAPDATSVDFKMARQVKKQASVQAWANPRWISERSMVIPPYEPDVTHRFSMDPSPFLRLINGAFIEGVPVKVHLAMLHMHQMGRSGRVEIVHADGSKECLLNIPKWQFHWQLPYLLSTPKVIQRGDQLAVECHFDNSPENQPFEGATRRLPRELNWGPNTDDEMCVAGVYLSQ